MLLSRFGFQSCSSQHLTVSEEKEHEESFGGNLSFGPSGMGHEYIISAYMRQIMWSELSIMQTEKCVLRENQGKGDMSLMTKVSSAPTGDLMEAESLVAWISLIEMILFPNTTKSKSKKDRMATCNNYHGL